MADEEKESDLSASSSSEHDNDEYMFVPERPTGEPAGAKPTGPIKVWGPAGAKPLVITLEDSTRIHVSPILTFDKDDMSGQEEDAEVQRARLLLTQKTKPYLSTLHWDAVTILVAPKSVLGDSPTLRKLSCRRDDTTYIIMSRGRERPR